MKAMTLSAATLMLLGTLTLGMAEDITSEMTVDEQITAIKNAPAQERVRLMNQFKVRLATMNEAEREAAIAQLRKQTQTRAESAEAEGEKMQTRTMTQERSRLNEMQQMQQQINQQQMRQQGTSGNSPTPNGMGH